MSVQKLYDVLSLSKTLTNHGLLLGDGDLTVSSLSTGTSGYVLLSQGSGSDPIWADPSSLFTGLQYWTESQSTSGVNATVPVSNFIPLNAGFADIDASISPKGTGALLAQIPDGTATGGNKRGSYAVDLQLSRGSSSQVASGLYSVITGGTSNTAGANFATVSGGSNNSVTGSYSSISGGSGNTVSITSANIAGGVDNTISGGGQFAVISGGNNNTASGLNCAIVGGELLTLSGSNDFGYLGRGSRSPYDMEIATNNIATFGNVDLWLTNNDNAPRALYFYEAYNAAGAFPNTAKWVSFKAPSAITTSQDYILPLADGTTGQVLSTDGSANLSWVTGTGGSISIGDPVGSAVNYEIFVADGSGDLAQIPLSATTGYILFSNGTGSAPIFQNGALVFVNITPTVSSPNNIQPSATGVIPLQLKTATASTSKAFNVISDASADFFNITYQGIVNTYLGLSLNGASNPLTLNTDPGTSGYALISQGAGVTPIWYDVGTAITGTQYSLLAGTGSPGVHSIPVPSQTGMVLNSQPSNYPNWTETPHLGKNGTNEGIIYFEALTTGNVQLAVPHSVTSYIFTLPPDGGTNGYLLQTNGSGTITYVNPSSVGMSNPMTTLGDIIYENATPTPARLAGNTTTNKKYLSQTGTGSISAVPAWDALLPGKGFAFVNPSGLTSAQNICIWRAPFACTVTNVRGYRVGGTGATINARKNGSSNHLSSDLSLTSADTWMDGGSVQNTAYAAGDKLEVMLVTVTGQPTAITLQVDYTT